MYKIKIIAIAFCILPIGCKRENTKTGNLVGDGYEITAVNGDEFVLLPVNSKKVDIARLNDGVMITRGSWVYTIKDKEFVSKTYSYGANEPGRGYFIDKSGDGLHDVIILNNVKYSLTWSTDNDLSVKINKEE